MQAHRHFRSYCADCGALLRSKRRLENHQASRCNALIWARKPATYTARRKKGG